MHDSPSGKHKSEALSLLSSERPRNVSWLQAGGLLFGDWGTSRLYVLGLAFFFAGRTSFWLILGMSVLILAVGWAYTQICRIYPDGGGVYTAAKHKSRTLAVVGALLLFADYTVTASLSVLDAFHYYGLPFKKHVQTQSASGATPTGFRAEQDAGAKLHVRDENKSETPRTPEEQAAKAYESELFHWDSPGLWAIIAIAVIGLFNLLGPRHTSGFAVFAAVGMIVISFGIVFAALLSGKVDWAALPRRIASFNHSPGHIWIAFVSIVLALSGVEAIANLTGIMKRPVAHTARRAIWIVALEVAIFNVILALFMHAIWPLPHDAHKEDMLAYLAKFFMGPWGEWAVRIIGGTLLLSAGNTAVNGLGSIIYVVSRDGEMPAIFQKVNRFGAPWMAVVLAAGVPILVLFFSHDLEHLAALYAIGVVGAVAINITLCATHPRLRRMRRKGPMLTLGILLMAIWVTLAATKLQALAFVAIVMAVGLTARVLTKWWAKRRGPRPSLLQRAITEQLTSEALAKPRLLVGTYGSDAIAPAALLEARQRDALLVVCFIREVALSYKYDGEERKLSVDTDIVAQKTFSRFLDLAHQMGVPILPVYDTGTNTAELMAENAAIFGVQAVLIGTSRRGAIYRLIKGHFQRKIEALLPPDIPVQVISPEAVQLAAEETAPGDTLVGER